MTQKTNLFKGQQKRKTIPPNRHGKIPQTRKGIYLFFFPPPLFRMLHLRLKIMLSLPPYSFRAAFPGKRFVKPSKTTKDMETDRVRALFSCLSSNLYGI